MSTTVFFQEIEHTPVPWRDYQLYAPLFYQDLMFLTISLLAPMHRLKALLPSSRLKPYRITPWHGALSITAYAYRECDLGPYNEVSIAIPVTIDRDTPLFTGTLRKMPPVLMPYILHLPVTTEIAREVGAEFAGYPKFIAEIEFVDNGNWLTCELRADNQHVLSVGCQKTALTRFPRYRVNPLTYRRGYLLRSELVIDERQMGRSRNGKEARLALGAHPIAEALRGMNLGKVLGYGYCPRAQAILTPVFESFAA